MHWKWTFQGQIFPIFPDSYTFNCKTLENKSHVFWCHMEFISYELNSHVLPIYKQKTYTTVVFWFVAAWLTGLFPPNHFFVTLTNDLWMPFLDVCYKRKESEINNKSKPHEMYIISPSFFWCSKSNNSKWNIGKQ